MDLILGLFALSAYLYFLVKRAERIVRKEGDKDE